MFEVRRQSLSPIPVNACNINRTAGKIKQKAAHFTEKRTFYQFAGSNKCVRMNSVSIRFLAVIEKEKTYRPRLFFNFQKAEKNLIL